MELNLKQIRAELRLFKSYVVNNKTSATDIQELDISSLEKGIAVLNTVPLDVRIEMTELYGIKDEWQNTFHKSFQTVIDTPIEVLVAQQLLHYFSTYGLEILGVFNSDVVYIPSEELSIPDFEGKIKLAVIREISKEELTEKLMALLTSGIALAKTTIDDIMTLSDFIDKDRFDEITNREVKLALYNKYDIVPKQAEEFLKYLIFQLTGSTMLIKSDELITSIKEADEKLIEKYLTAYIRVTGSYDGLATIFRTYKVFILCLKRKDNKKINSIINKIRRASNRCHKPKVPSVLDRLTSIRDMAEDGNTFSWNYKISPERDKPLYNWSKQSFTEKELIAMLDKITVFREIRILNAMRYRVSSKSESVLYKIRNGKTYTEDLPYAIPDTQFEAQKRLIDIVSIHLEDRINQIVKGKTIYIPDNVDYVLPTTEKQFMENYPIGTTITLPRDKNIVVGVHWKNGKERVDLDLHAYTRTGHFGWNAMYTSANDDVVFSGDITDAPAPKGATECYFISSKLKTTSFLLKLKNFTSNSFDVPFELIVAYCDDDEITQNYTINPNNVIAKLNLVLPHDVNAMVRPDQDIALVEVDRGEIKLSLVKYNTSGSISGTNEEVLKRTINYSETYPKAQLHLLEVLKSTDCILTDAPYTDVMEEVKTIDEDGKEEVSYKKKQVPVDFDLSLDSITKDTLIKMLM